MNISVNVEISSSKNKVWSTITDLNNCVKMITAVSDIKILNKPENELIGLKWTETRKMFGKEATETMWITEAKDQQYYCTRGENCGAIYTTKLSVSEVDDNTLLTMDFASTSDSIFVRLMSSVMGFFFKNAIKKMLPKDLNDIKHFVEEN